MTPIKRKLLYIFRGSLLRLRISWNHGTTLTLSVGYHVDRTDAKGKPKWDGSRCIRNTTHGENKVPAATINKVLEQLEDKIDKAFLLFENNDIIPSCKELKNEITGAPKATNETDIIDAYEEFLNEGKTLFQWSENTFKKMKTIKHLLKLFDSKQPKERKLSFSSFDTDVLQKLMAFQTSNSVSGVSKNEIEVGKTIVHYKGKYQNNTINRNITLIKWFLKWASQKGYYDPSLINDFKLKYKKTKKPVIFLTWEELMKMYHLDLKKHPELEKTRDMFCFCCFTSLRHSDMDNLKWGNVSENAIQIVTQKTAASITIDLNDYSKEILEKYRADNSIEDDYVFPRKSSQKMNLRLKQIAKSCGIDTPISFIELYGSERKEIIVPKYELITTHCGRRTFISNALAMGIPPNVVMKWTGHSDYKAMMPYIEIADEIKKQNMAKFNKA